MIKIQELLVNILQKFKGVDDTCKLADRYSNEDRNLWKFKSHVVIAAHNDIFIN